MITFEIKVEEVQSNTKPDPSIVVNFKTDAKEPTELEISYAEAIKKLLSGGLHLLMSKHGKCESVEGIGTDGFKKQINAMLHRHGLPGIPFKENEE